jgi:hypothetical protein
MFLLVERIIFFIFFTMANVHAEPVANHAEVAIFREKEADAIVAKKRELRTQLDVVGALAVLENELNVGHDPIENSRLVLGMVLGNGYKDGVTTRLVASPQEKAIIERIVKKAAAHVRAPFNVGVGDVSGAPAKAMEHIGTLNRWITAVVAKKDPQFAYEAKRAEPYKTLDQIIDDIGRAFAANPMIQHAIRLKDNRGDGVIAKQFIVCFSKLTGGEQAAISKAYDDSMILAFTQEDRDAEFHTIALQCQNKTQAIEFVRSQARALPPPAIVPMQPHPAVGLPPAAALVLPRVVVVQTQPDAGPPAAVVAAPVGVSGEDGVNLAKIDHLLAELRRFDDISHSGRYAEVSKTILLMKALYENKGRIIDFANRNWENVRLMRDIDSVAHPSLKISKGHSQSEYFRAVIEDSVIKAQYDLRDRVDPALTYAPVFETVDYVFGGPIVDLPTDQAGRDLIFTTVTTHLIDGARMLTKAANWLEGNPAYYRTFFTGNWGDNSGCIPKRNEMLSNWIDVNTKVLTGKYIYDNFLSYSFDRSVGMLIDLFRKNCYVSVIKDDTTLMYVSDDTIEEKPAFKRIYTKAKFIEWVQPVARDAYRSSIRPDGFEHYGWNDAARIGSIWDAIVFD